VARAGHAGHGRAGLAPRGEAIAPSAIWAGVGGRSTSTQWKKSTRGSSAGTSRPGWLTSSPLLGTSKSWQISTTLCVPTGRSDQARCGLRLSLKVARPAPSGRPAAWRAGMRSPLVQLSLQSFMGRAPVVQGWG
jgi:hypothetical protein